MTIGIVGLVWLCLFVIFILSFMLYSAHGETRTLKRVVKRLSEGLDKYQSDLEMLEIDNIKILKEALLKTQEKELECDLLRHSLGAEMKKNIDFGYFKKDYEEVRKENNLLWDFIHENADKQYREYCERHKDDSL